MVKVGRERADLALQLKENEEEMQELIKKYKVGLNCSIYSCVNHLKSGQRMFVKLFLKPGKRCSRKH